MANSLELRAFTRPFDWPRQPEGLAAAILALARAGGFPHNTRGAVPHSTPDGQLEAVRRHRVIDK